MKPMPPLLGFGASTMQGVGDSQGGFLKRLARLLAGDGKDFPLRPHGVGGDTTVDMVRRLDSARKDLPATTIVLLGCNDVPRDPDRHPAKRTTLEVYEQNLKLIFQTLAGPGSLFVTSFAVNPATGVTANRMDPYMATALRIAKAHGYRTWDLYGESKGWGDRHWAPDGIHYRDEGHALLAERIHQLLTGS